MGGSIPPVLLGYGAPSPAGTGLPRYLAMPAKNISWEDSASPSLQSGNREVLACAAERNALNDLFSVTYEELRRLASSVRRSDPSATLSPTALVNEAWLKLANSPGLASASRLHFKRIAARAMRQLLVEAARRRNAGKRGGGESIHMVTFDESLPHSGNCAKEVIALDLALQELARFQPRQASVVESRFFGGCDISETAALLGVSEATILRDWRAAKAWLAQALRQVH
jgi:RNA polymerase sigma factor (TIGR02999 family)